MPVGGGLWYSSMNQPILLLLVTIVCLLVLNVHLPALSARALCFDDSQYLMDNPLVQYPSWTSTWRFLREVAEPSTVEGYYQPLAMISLMVDYALGGRPGHLMPFHRTSLVLHVANTGLIILLLHVLFADPWVAAAVGLLFGLHPMTVECIAWLSERKTLLATFFALSSLLFYVRYTQRRRRAHFVGALTAYVLALLSKPTATPLPLLMLVTDYWPLDRVSWRGLREKIPFLAVGGCFAIVTFLSQSRAAGVLLPDRYGLSHVLLTVSHNVTFYLGKILWPANLSAYYPFPNPLTLSDPSVLAGVIGTIGLTLLSVVFLRWTPAPLAGLLFFVVAILPTMQVVRFSDVIASDKFVYLPSLGLLMLVAWFLKWVLRVAGPGTVVKRRLVMGVLVLLLGTAEAVATRRYLACWRDTVTLYQQMLAKSPETPMLHADMGLALASLGRGHEAVRQYREALRLCSDYHRARFNLAVELSKSPTTTDDAVEEYRRILDADPSFYKAQTNLGLLLESNGNHESAIDCFRQAVLANPQYVKGHANLGRALIRAGFVHEGLMHVTRAVQLGPAYAPALKHLAWVLCTHPRPDARDPAEAVRRAERMVKRHLSHDPRALDILAAAYAANNHFDRAVATAERALDLAVNENMSELASTIRRRLGLYRKGQPCIEDPAQYDKIGTLGNSPNTREPLVVPSSSQGMRTH